MLKTHISATRSLSDSGVRNKTSEKFLHFLRYFKAHPKGIYPTRGYRGPTGQIVSLFNDKSTGLPICTDKVRPEGVRYREVPHVKEWGSGGIFHCLSTPAWMQVLESGLVQRPRIIHSPTDS